MRRAAETDAGIQMVVTTGDNFYMFAPHPPHPSVRNARLGASLPTLEATQGQIDGVCSQLPYKCHQNRVASVGY